MKNLVKLVSKFATVNEEEKEVSITEGALLKLSRQRRRYLMELKKHGFRVQFELPCV